MSGTQIKLLVGLGNPGAEYAASRHNAGFWFLDRLAAHHGGLFKMESGFRGLLSRLQLDGHDCRLLKPSTFMNRSGQSVAAVMRYFDLAPGEILVAHDELDLPAGTARLKCGGGHAGHNGLRDLIAALGSRDFCRLRIGVAHPGDQRSVVDYVLSRPSREDAEAIERSFEAAEKCLPLMLQGHFQQAMNRLHSGV